MKKQCNLCGLRNDTVELVQMNKTWCLVYDKEVDNKLSGCEYWKPDDSSIRNEKVQIANGIKRSIQSKFEQESRQKVESERDADAIEQQVLNRESAEKIANRAFIIAIISALIALEPAGSGLVYLDYFGKMVQCQVSKCSLLVPSTDGCRRCRRIETMQVEVGYTTVAVDE